MTTKELFKCSEHCLTSNNCEDCPKDTKGECPFECATSTHTLYNILKQAVLEIEAAKNQLPACPFCGSEIIDTINLIEKDSDLVKAGYTSDNWLTVCVNCGATSGNRRTKEEAIAAWRKRAEQ